MRILSTVFATPLLLTAFTGNCLAADLGVVRGISPDATQLTIDEGRYTLSPALRINNIGGRLNRISAVVTGQPVRFTLDAAGRIDELWLYPKRADKRAELGITLEDGPQ